ncbi:MULTISPECIES: rhomboid family intramembrane serine protease [unclassified Thioalkalivibrio]|uniref:rhomboid family intramembrane serine protease n=1 Tax=unclassified Thioalkalivibrio TaxID=2621013 RepID=UPI00035EB170|nr:MULTISPECIES: rhomboid family intramembrane serine protease [unclassified Thioalkalivibrio]
MTHPDPRHPDFSMLPPVIGFLLITNVALFLAMPWLGDWLVNHFGLWPVGTPATVHQDGSWMRVPDFQLWQLVSYGFLHGGPIHLFVNLFAVWMLGVQIENAWGSRTFAVYFLVCVIGAGLVQLFVTAYGNGDMIYPTIGASGGVFGVLLAFGMMFPNQRLFLIFLPIPIKAKYFVIGYGALELYLGISGTLAGIAHFAHLGGMAFGFLLIQYWRDRLPIRPRQRRFWW